MVSGFLSCFELKSALAELRSTTGGFEAVFFTLLHARVTGKETSLFDGGLELLVCLYQRAGNAMADGARLAGKPAAV